ncbi:alpha/beta hydrolase [Chamaesiphon sp.]|uniref:alpha/beta hydrolase n=1 Tax=Chamaesiphon sp. TaxID=2814140 RepID=UPI003593779B
MVACSSRIKLSVGQISWREVGDARLPTVIFLHGSWHDRTQWQEAIAILSSSFHCLAIDLLGYGNSTAIETPTAISIEVDALHEFLTALKLHSVYLVGHSLGAWVALSYTLKFPDRVLGVVAISPEGSALPTWQQYGRSTIWLLSQPWLFTLWLRSLQILTSLGDGDVFLAKSQAYWHFFTKFPTTCKLLFERSTGEIKLELITDRLAQIRSPLLVLNNENAALHTSESGEFSTRVVGKSKDKSIERLNYAFSSTATSYLTQEITAFVDRIQAQIDREEVELW